METATVETGAVVDTQPAETDSQPVETKEAQAPAASKPSLKELLKREKDDPNVKFTDAELDVLDAHYEKEAKPKTKAADPEPKDETEDDEGEKPEAKPKAEPKEKEEPETEPEEPEEESDDPAVKALLSEVGAKSLKDAAAKVKQLRTLIGGKDAQAVAKITKERDDLAKNGRELWTALKNGDQKAIAFAEKQFGVKFAGPTQKTEAQPPVSMDDDFINPDQFIDPESAKLVNAAFKKQADVIKALESKFGTIEQERDRHIQDTLAKQSMMTVVDEMAKIAQRIPELKGMAGFREAAQSVLDGKPDPRLEAHFSELFDIASRIPGATLMDAFDIKRGRDADRIEQFAREQGRKDAYNVKPNPSLSGQTGNKGEDSYQPVTDALLEKWESDHSTHPDSWYDKDGELIQSKIPKRAWKIFGFK